MRIIKKSSRRRPRVSLVLLDWSVRESFHLLHYLKDQTVSREDFEVIVIEFYDTVSRAVSAFEEEIDTWIVLDTPESCYYHKHLMYNAGIVFAKGDIVMIGDSDAMVRPTFVQSIIEQFDRDPNIVYHMDQFRNLRRDFYSFNYPEFDEVLGEGCINNQGGRTTGVLDVDDPLHSRNYGACMCARREDLLAIGGADMHIDYLGHICGPYDMTFRLTNLGRREVWDLNEFTYHTWHPGQAGGDNYLGPHDGRHMSTTAIEAITSGRILPLEENRAIGALREQRLRTAEEAAPLLIDVADFESWDRKHLHASDTHEKWSDYATDAGTYKGFQLVDELGRVIAFRITDFKRPQAGSTYAAPAVEGVDADMVKSQINQMTSRWIDLAQDAALCYALAYRFLQSLSYRAGTQMRAVPRPIGISIIFLLAVVAAPIAAVARPHQLTSKLRRIFATARDKAESLASALAAMASMAAAGRKIAYSDMPAHVVADKEAAFFFRMIAFFLPGPKPEITLVTNARDLEAFLVASDGNGADTPTIMMKSTYVQYHNVFSENASEFEPFLV